jgi:hypothetical protein
LILGPPSLTNPVRAAPADRTQARVRRLGECCASAVDQCATHCDGSPRVVA